jgi:hypothetical protein
MFLNKRWKVVFKSEAFSKKLFQAFLLAKVILTIAISNRNFQKGGWVCVLHQFLSNFDSKIE